MVLVRKKKVSLKIQKSLQEKQEIPMCKDAECEEIYNGCTGNILREKAKAVLNRAYAIFYPQKIILKFTYQFKYGLHQGFYKNIFTDAKRFPNLYAGLKEIIS